MLQSDIDSTDQAIDTSFINVWSERAEIQIVEGSQDEKISLNLITS